MVGVSPLEFWQLTPWQFGILLEAYSDKEKQDFDVAVWLVWHGAYFERAKKLPRLKDFMQGSKKQSKGIDETAIMARLKAYQKRVENGSSS